MSNHLKDALLFLKNIKTDANPLVFPSPQTGKHLTDIKKAIRRIQGKQVLKEKYHSTSYDIPLQLIY